MSIIKKIEIPDNKRTYEKTIPFFDSVLCDLWFKMTENTKKDLVILLRMMWYVDHMYDKKNVVDKEEFKNLYFEKFRDKKIDVWEMNDTANQLYDILIQRWLTDDFLFYANKLFHWNNLACSTENCKEFIKYKYYEWHMTAKLVELFLEQDENSEDFTFELNKLLSNTVAISNILDDFLDLKSDYKNWISKLSPTFSSEIQLFLAVVYNTYYKVLKSWKINAKVALKIFSCLKSYVIKTIKLNK